MQVVGHAHVHHVHVAVCDQVFGPREDLIEAQVIGKGLGEPAGQVGDADEVIPGHPRRSGVHTTDEARADDPDSEWLSHPASLWHGNRLHT